MYKARHRRKVSKISMSFSLFLEKFHASFKHFMQTLANSHGSKRTFRFNTFSKLGKLYTQCIVQCMHNYYIVQTQQMYRVYNDEKTLTLSRTQSFSTG